MFKILFLPSNIFILIILENKCYFQKYNALSIIYMTSLCSILFNKTQPSQFGLKTPHICKTFPIHFNPDPQSRAGIKSTIHQHITGSHRSLQKQENSYSPISSTALHYRAWHSYLLHK